jgi:hypothetical protein
MKTLRITEILCGLTLIGLFFQPYLRIGPVGVAGHEINKRVSTTYNIVSRISKKTDVTVAYQYAPLIYSIPFFAAIVAMQAVRGGTVAPWALAAAAIALGAVTGLNEKILGMPLVRIGPGAYLSLIPAGVLWAAGVARAALHHTPSLATSPDPPPAL